MSPMASTSASPHKPTRWWIWIVVPPVVVVTGLSIWLGPYILEEKITRRLEKHDVVFYYKDESKVRHPPIYLWLRRMTGLRSIGNPAQQSWVFIDEKLTGKPLQDIAKDLRFLALPMRVHVTHSGSIAGDLETLPRELITDLGIRDLEVPATAVRVIQGMKRLRDLELTGCQLDRQAFEGLGALTELKHLVLDQTTVTDDDLVPLAKLSNLTLLTLSNTQVSDAAKEKLNKSLPNLEISDD